MKTKQLLFGIIVAIVALFSISCSKENDPSPSTQRSAQADEKVQIQINIGSMDGKGLTVSYEWGFGDTSYKPTEYRWAGGIADGNYIGIHDEVWIKVVKADRPVRIVINEINNHPKPDGNVLAMYTNLSDGSVVKFKYAN